MSAAYANPTGIVRWEILNGLPSEAPLPRHFHLGHPTPWAEGFVMRFRNEDGAVWIANFSGFFEFPDPRIGVIISRGTCYFLPFDHPDQMANGSGEITSAIQSESGNLILGSLTGEMVAFDRLGRLMWRRNDFAADDLIVRSCVSGTIVADVEDWHGNWCIIRVAEDSGADR